MTHIGFIGAGKMGSGVVLNLQKVGHDCTVLVRENRTFTAELADCGALLVADLEDCLLRQDVIFLCLPSMPSWSEVTQFLCSRAKAGALLDGALVIDLTSARPDATAALAGELAALDIGFIDAPMLKGPAASRSATIQLLVGGTPSNVERALPYLTSISEAQHVTGGPGTGHALKLINNAVTLTNSAIVYETFALAAHMGIDLELAYTAMRQSAAGSKRLDAIAPTLMSGDHSPSFDVATALKDLELYNDMARQEGALSFSGSSARHLYQLGAMLGLSQSPVTQLGEMMFDLTQGRCQEPGIFDHKGIGNPGSIAATTKTLKRTQTHA